MSPNPKTAIRARLVFDVQSSRIDEYYETFREFYPRARRVLVRMLEVQGVPLGDFKELVQAIDQADASKYGYRIGMTCRALRLAAEIVQTQALAKSVTAPSGKKRSRRGKVASDGFAGVAALVKQMHKERYTQAQMCERLDRMPRPPRAGWKHLSWVAAFKNPEYRPAVKSFLSKLVRAVTE